MSINTEQQITTADMPEAEAPAANSTDTGIGGAGADAAELTGKGERPAHRRGRAPKAEKAAGGPARGRKPAVAADTPKDGGKAARPAKKKARGATGSGDPRKPSTGTKQEALVTMLRRAQGATIDEIVDATGWQKHTVRGAISGALKKKLGLTIGSGKVEGRGRVYRIAG